MLATTPHRSVCVMMLPLLAVACATNPPVEPSFPADTFSAFTVFRPGEDIVNPRVLRSADPDYTQAAMRARIQGEVRLDIVVLADGTVGDVVVTKSLDMAEYLSLSTPAPPSALTASPPNSVKAGWVRSIGSGGKDTLPCLGCLCWRLRPTVQSS